MFKFTRILFLLIISISVSAQNYILFDAKLDSIIDDSLGVFTLKLPNFDKNYYNFKNYTITAPYYTFEQPGNKVLVEYDDEGYICYIYKRNVYLDRMKRNMFSAKLDRILDGDTFWAYVKVPNGFGGFNRIRQKIRLFSCDTPEKFKSKMYLREFNRRETNAERSERLEWSKDATTFALNLLTTQEFRIQYVHKYRNSRIVCVVWFEDGSTLKSRLKSAGFLTGKYENF